MLEQLREVLTREQITSAAIIDDVYDAIPISEDINSDWWQVFVDDVSEQEVAIIREGYTEPEDRWDELRLDDNFIKFLWEHRDDGEAIKKLFVHYETDRAAGQLGLEPLRTLLFEELHLQGNTYGARELNIPDGTQLIFIDLFLGTTQDKEARDKAMQRVKELVAARREAPPMVILMSSSTRLPQLRDEFRDEAELLGSQFRVMPKSLLDDPAEVYELITRLAASYQDALRVSGFLYL